MFISMPLSVGSNSFPVVPVLEGLHYMWLQRKNIKMEKPIHTTTTTTQTKHGVDQNTQAVNTSSVL